MNMARMERSRERVALPGFDTNELLKLIKKLVAIEARWIPRLPGYSLYIRPTLIGTRACKSHHGYCASAQPVTHLTVVLGVAASDSAMLYVVCCPTGPYFRTGARMLSLKAVGQHVRSWPGGTGGYKLSGNYSPTFMPQKYANEEGYDQVLWLIGDNITEAGAMNFFVAIKRDDGGTSWPLILQLASVRLISRFAQILMSSRLRSTALSFPVSRGTRFLDS